MRRIGAVILLLGCATTSFAHYNMLMPDKAWANKGEKVTFTYQFGHPFEHELFDAPEPKAVIVILPDGKTQKIEKLTKIELKGADGKKATGYNFVYEPATRGDYTFVLQTPPIWMEESKEFWQDTVKVVLHVQTQKNWDADPTIDVLNRLKVVPLTRPYGLFPGMVVQGRVHLTAEPDKAEPAFPGKMIEIERYPSHPVKNPPPDELITFKTKTDPNGIFTFAFPDAGWWSMTAAWQKKDRKWNDGANEGPLRERATLWIHVDEKK